MSSGDGAAVSGGSPGAEKGHGRDMVLLVDKMGPDDALQDARAFLNTLTATFQTTGVVDASLREVLSPSKLLNFPSRVVTLPAQSPERAVRPPAVQRAGALVHTGSCLIRRFSGKVSV